MIDDIERLITDDMRALIGDKGPVREMPEEISASDVRRFTEVVGETNPIYRDDASAQKFGYKKRVVPPMLAVQFFRRMDDTEGDTPRMSANEWPGLTLPPTYTNSRNAGHEFTWLRPVYVGDRLSLQQRFKDIYVRQGRKGVPVIYVVRETEIRNQDGEPVLLQSSTVAKLPEASAKGE